MQELFRKVPKPSDFLLPLKNDILLQWMNDLYLSSDRDTL